MYSVFKKKETACFKSKFGTAESTFLKPDFQRPTAKPTDIVKTLASNLITLACE